MSKGHAVFSNRILPSTSERQPRAMGMTYIDLGISDKQLKREFLMQMVSLFGVFVACLRLLWETLSAQVENFHLNCV